MRKAAWAGGILVILLVAGHFIVHALIQKKVDDALRALPPSLKVSYTALHSHLFGASLIIEGLRIRFSPDSHVHEATIRRMTVDGIGFFELLAKHRLRARVVLLEECKADLDEYLIDKKIPLPAIKTPFTDVSIGRLTVAGLEVTVHKGEKKNITLEGSGELDSVYAAVAGKAGFGEIRSLVKKMRYRIPSAEEVVHLSNMEVDSKRRWFRLDTMKILPDRDKEEIGRTKGHQVDVVEATSEGIEAEGADVMGLLKNRLVADRITVHRNNIHVFRDRRLPLEPGDKPLPVEALKALPISLRVRQVSIGTTTFSYEEFPAKGEKPGTMTIYRLNGKLEPLINKPEAGDPAYITMTMEGSLMNSGLVTSTTKMPLRKGDPYLVDGAFHELDVTKLNNPAENLGKLHLESGMLNSLEFRFQLGEEKATGKIVGVYHNLVVGKLKENGRKDKLKSFALKQFIIPRDKDRSLPESKRTGKVDYTRDRQRYFSYYLLHSLLVGVKSSFSLGFLLPG